jgi:hypothetical protein
LDVIILVLMWAFSLQLADTSHSDPDVSCGFYLLYFNILSFRAAFGVPLKEWSQSACRKKNVDRWLNVPSYSLVLVKQLVRKNRVEESLFLCDQVRFGLNDFKVENVSRACGFSSIFVEFLRAMLDR